LFSKLFSTAMLDMTIPLYLMKQQENLPSYYFCFY
jgi:hypothetical protein